MFSDEIQAWSHGPVVKDVYHEVKQYGAGAITLPEDDPVTWDKVDAETADWTRRATAIARLLGTEA